MPEASTIYGRWGKRTCALGVGVPVRGVLLPVGLVLVGQVQPRPLLDPLDAPSSPGRECLEPSDDAPYRGRAQARLPGTPGGLGTVSRTAPVAVVNGGSTPRWWSPRAAQPSGKLVAEAPDARSSRWLSYLMVGAEVAGAAGKAVRRILETEAIEGRTVMEADAPPIRYNLIFRTLCACNGRGGGHDS